MNFITNPVFAGFRENASGSNLDAQAFFAAAGITNVTQKSAVNKLVRDLKNHGLWTKIYVIYPFVGGTESSHKFNLKNPLDSNAANRIVFINTWTHSATGAKPDGTTAYANTNFIANTISGFNPHSFSASAYIQTLGSPSGSAADIGGMSSSTAIITFSAKRANSQSVGSNGNQTATAATGQVTDWRGFWINNRQSNSVLRLVQQNTLVAQNTTTVAAAALNIPIFLSGLNYYGSVFAGYYSDRELSFVSFQEGLTNVEETNFNTIVQAFQTDLGRNIS